LQPHRVFPEWNYTIRPRDPISKKWATYFWTDAKKIFPDPDLPRIHKPYYHQPSPKEALATARHIQDTEACTRALIDLAPHLPAELKDEALAMACAIWNKEQRDASSALAPTLPEPLQAETLAAVCAIQDEGTRAKRLVACAPTLSDALKVEALAVARAFQTQEYRARVLSALAPTLPNELRIEAINEAVHLIYGLIDHERTRRPELYRKTVFARGKERFDGFQRQLWPETLHALAQHTRRELLDDLTALLPLIEHLGGQAAIEGFFYALRDVTTWWPWAATTPLESSARSFSVILPVVRSRRGGRATTAQAIVFNRAVGA
jgi:hypothetical protein